MEAYDKPFLTYDEQIDCLIEKHGLDVSDRDFARRVLRSVSYYDLINGYKDAFMVNEKYGEHMSIEFLYSFYIFDKRFLFTPKDNSRNEVMKKALFDSYAHAANLPMSLPDRLEVFHDCLRDK